MFKFYNNACLLFILFVLSCNTDTDNKKIVAEVNGENLYSEELDRLIIQEIYDELNRIYTIKDLALNKLIERKLLLRESEKQCLTPESYLNNFIDSVINHNSYDSLLVKYNVGENFHHVHNTSLFNISTNTYEGKLIQEKKLRKAIKDKLIDSLTHSSIIEKYLYPPQSPKLNNLEEYVTSYRGNKNSHTTMILISDFDCGRCIDFHSIYDSIYDNYKDKIKFGYINFSGLPSTAIIASEACNSQDMFWKFYDIAYKNNEYIDSVKAFNIAEELNLDMNKFAGEFNSPELINRIENSFKKLHEYGIYATPTIIINNRLLFNSGSYKEIERLLEIELKKQK